MKNRSSSKSEIHGHTHRRLLSYAAGVPAYLGISAGLSFLLTVTVIIQMFSLSLIVAEVVTHHRPPGMLLIVVFVGCILLRSVLSWFRERLARQKSVLLKSAIKQQAFAKIVALGPLFTRAEKTGGLINMLTEGTEKLEDYFTHYIPSLVHIAILPTAIILFAFYLDWPSALVLLITGPLIVFFMWLIGTYARKISHDQWMSLSRLSAGFLDAIQGLKTLKLFGVSEMESERIADSSNGFRIITMRVLKVAFLSGMVLELAASISIALVAVQVGIRLIEGMMSFQPGLFMLLLAPEFYLPFRALGQHHHTGMEGSAAATEIFSVIDMPEQRKHTSTAQLPSGSAPEIRCNGLQYTYPGQKNSAISELSCTLPAGRLTAIVGPSGSGKTTFVHLLLGYIRPDKGTIQADGQRVFDMDPDVWRSNVAFVSQHPRFFNGSILDNLLMARPSAGMDEVREAARQAGAYEFITGMPNGYQTILSDNASRLSGGEKQRLALARALLRNAPLLILDEPTSYLDPESEQKVTGASLGAAKGRTTLVIAHRLRTVRHADHILVFDKGRIAERGNHHELISKRGLYHSFLATLGMTIAHQTEPPVSLQMEPPVAHQTEPLVSLQMEPLFLPG
ncbi:MAG: thiol reductant ABC exporter subunit CydD [Bacteroidales bacterium]|nr:thiol reductant ABC exporter subunit CydD [Bacteroidales bacterium]